MARISANELGVRVLLYEISEYNSEAISSSVEQSLLPIRLYSRNSLILK